MKINFLGTCAGTEPMPNRRHTAFAVESGGKVYWFDAGEGCSYTAYLMGLDLLRVCKVLISHPHMDHVGGLGNLFWNIRKLCVMGKTQPCYGDIDLYIPCLETWQGFRMILENTEGSFQTSFRINAHEVTDGVLFDDGTMQVTAYHNHHLRNHNFAPWHSFTYRIEAEGKAVVYSGDVGACEDLDDAIGGGCDALIMETGHHSIQQVYEYTRCKTIGKVFFNHCGREILNDPIGAERKIEKKFGDAAVICQDMMVAEL